MEEIIYTITRQKRKTMALYIHKDGVEVRAPFRTPLTEIDRFVQSKRAWVERKRAELLAAQGQKSAFTVDYGSILLYRGGGYYVDGVPGRHVYFDGAFCVPLYLTGGQVKHACVQIYRILARQDLTEKAHQFAAKMGVHFDRLRVNGAKTRWGSCSARGSLNFSWRLMMAEDDVIDYVVVHELAHLKEMNHSDRFWAVVAAELPDYNQRRARLRALQEQLNAEDWE